MRTHTVKVQWLEWLPVTSGYSLRSQVVRNVRAAGVVEASEIALAPFINRICASVASVWYDWPQPKGTV